MPIVVKVEFVSACNTKITKKFTLQHVQKRIQRIYGVKISIVLNYNKFKQIMSSNQITNDYLK